MSVLHWLRDNIHDLRLMLFLALWFLVMVPLVCAYWVPSSWWLPAIFVGYLLVGAAHYGVARLARALRGRDDEPVREVVLAFAMLLGIAPFALWLAIGYHAAQKAIAAGVSAAVALGVVAYFAHTWRSFTR